MKKRKRILYRLYIFLISLILIFSILNIISIFNYNTYANSIDSKTVQSEFKNKRQSEEINSYLDNNNNDNLDETKNVINNASEDVNIEGFIKEADKYSKNTLNLNIQGMLEDAIKGKVNNRNIIDSISNVIFKELNVTFKSFGVILIIVILNAIIKSISDNLDNTAISEIIYMVQYILILTIILKDFISVLELTNNTIYNLIGFCNSLFPILTTLIIMSGKVVSFSTFEPILLFLITIIANCIGSIIIPFVMLATIFNVTSNISDMVQLSKISKFIKSSIIWFLGILLTLFVAIISIEGTLSSNVDAVTIKTTKAAVSNLIPIVGKVLGDAVDTVLGATNLLKNAVGIVGVIIIICICIIPVIKLAILSITYTILSNLCSVMADRKIVQVLSEIATSFKLLLAIIASVATLLIIGITIVIKMTSVMPVS